MESNKKSAVSPAATFFSVKSAKCSISAFQLTFYLFVVLLHVHFRITDITTQFQQRTITTAEYYTAALKLYRFLSFKM